MKKAGALTLRESQAQKHFLITKSQPKGKWRAMVKPPNGTRPSKSISVAGLGEGEAFRLAVKARKKLLAMMEDRPYLYNRTARRSSQ